MTTNASGIPSAKSGYSPISFLGGSGALQTDMVVVDWLLILFFFLGEGQSKLILMLNVEVGEHLIDGGNKCFSVQFFQSVILRVNDIASVYDLAVWWFHRYT